MRLDIMPQKVKLVTGLISNNEEAMTAAQEALSDLFGKKDFVSGALPFDRTTYYSREMGEGLKRRFVSFEMLTDLESIENRKLQTIDIEKKLSRSDKRTVNIDPGYLELSKFVLLTTKNYSHRIYLGRGIFAEVTLLFRNGTFSSLEWTYPDYQSAEYIGILNHIRNIYRTQLKGA
jgi:hypothetical protein